MADDLVPSMYEGSRVVPLVAMGRSTRSGTRGEWRASLPAYLEEVRICGHDFDHVIADTGSCASIVSDEVLSQIKPAALEIMRFERPQVDVKSVDGSALSFTGTVSLPLEIEGQVFKHTFKIMTGGGILVLGNDFLGAFQGELLIGVAAGKDVDRRVSSLSLLHPDGARVRCNRGVGARKALGGAYNYPYGDR